MSHTHAHLDRVHRAALHDALCPSCDGCLPSNCTCGPCDGECQPEATSHRCAEFLRTTSAELGLEVTVTTVPPLTRGPYTTDPFTCPHGVTYWMEPTGEQITQWVKDGTP